MIKSVKKLSLFIGGILLASLSFGFWETISQNSSSFTLTNEGTIAISSNNLQGGVLVAVVIGSSTPGGLIRLFDSRNPSGVNVSTIGIVNLGGTGIGANNEPNTIPFNVHLSSGLSYKTEGNSNGVTIIYKITKPTTLGY